MSTEQAQLSEQPAAARAGAPLAALRRIAVVPAFNEEGNIGRLLAELAALDPDLAVVVVSDGSTDRTAEVAAAAGAHVVSLPFNLGIGAAVQTGFRYAWEGGYELAVRLDGDGQHDPAQLRAVVAPVVAGEADLAIGSRFLERGGYRSSAARRFGIRVLARVVSWIAHERLTDTTSGFQALNRRTIRLFAADLPRDYPEVEGLVMAIRHRLRVKEVPVTMREREHGRSSIGSLASIYYMIKVLLAIFVDLFRRDVVPLEDE
jgi:glycosyltransferase involved in cell wall biosynthesis